MIRLGAGVATDSRVRVSILIAADLAHKENGGDISRFRCGVSCEVQIVPRHREYDGRSGASIAIRSKGGSMTVLEFGPARARHLDQTGRRPYSRAMINVVTIRASRPPPRSRGTGGRLRLRYQPLPPDPVPRPLPEENAV